VIKSNIKETNKIELGRIRAIVFGRTVKIIRGVKSGMRLSDTVSRYKC